MWERREKTTICKPRRWTSGRTICPILVSDLQPPEPQDNKCLAQAPQPTIPCDGGLSCPTHSTSGCGWDGSHPLEHQVCIFRKEIMHTDPLVKALSLQGRKPPFEVKGAISLVFLSVTSILDTQHPTHIQPGSRALSLSRPGLTTPPVCLSNQPPFLKRTSRSHLSGVFFP